MSWPWRRGKEVALAEPQARPRVRDVLHVWRALRLVWEAAPGWSLVNLGMTVAQGLVPLAQVWLMKLIVDAITRGVASPDHAAAFRTAATWIGVAAAVGLAAAFLRALAALVNEAMGQVVTDHVADVIHAQSIAVDLEYYENPRYYDVLHRAQQEAPYRPLRIINDLTTTGQALISLVAMASLLLTLHWLVGVVVVAAAVPGALVRLRFSGQLYRWQRQRTVADRLSVYLHWLLTDGARAKEVRLFDLGEVFRRWYRELRQTLRRERLAIARRRALGDVLSGAGAVAAVFGTFAYIAWQTIRGAISVGSMVMYYQAFQTSLTSLQQALGGLAGLYEDNLFLTYFHEFMALAPRLRRPPRPRPLPRPLREGVVFHGVTFRYPDSERTALVDVDLAIRPGEVCALVGHNGSGKTTLVKLLCRLYDPTAGCVTVDGVDLRELDPVELRRAVSVVFQDFSQYQFTARRNIWVGDVALPEDSPRIEAAARDAGAHDVLAGLRRGYDTPLGKLFDEGEELSIGEWQKVALARAFVRDAEVLVFDEPTSALDPAAEAKVFEHIRALARGRAVVLVSHRFSTVRLADRIHLMERGRIVESGSHEELVARGGVYAQLYELQARAYRLGQGE